MQNIEHRQGYRRQFGESLIRIGERLAANRDSVYSNRRLRQVQWYLLFLLQARVHSRLGQSQCRPRWQCRPVHRSQFTRKYRFASPPSPSQQIPIQHAAGLQTQPEASSPKPPELKSKAIAPTQPYRTREALLPHCQFPCRPLRSRHRTLRSPL